MNIQGAITAGYTAKQILNYLSSAFPELGHRIKEAVNVGKNAEDILKYINNVDPSKLSKMKGRSSIEKPFQNTSQVNPLIEGQRATKEYDPIPQAVKTGAKLGVGALAGMAAAPLVNKGIQNAGPVVGQMLGKVFGQGQQNLPGQETQPTIPEFPQEETTTTQMQPPTVDSESILNQFGMKDRVDAMLQAGNNPEQISTALNSLLKGPTRKDFGDKLKKGEIPPLNQIVQDYIQKAGVTKQEVNPTETVSKNEIEKGSDVLTPNGLAKVISSNGDNALIERDGKKEQVKIDKLIPSPLPEKELNELYDDLLRGIEKKTGQDVSRMVNFAGYDPENNELVFKPHDGALYVYKDIDQEDVGLLTNFLTQRKTTGSNYIGSWGAGTGSPIGAAMSQLIKKLQSQSGGKGKEYIRKYQTIYDYMEPARQDLKAKKDEERKKRKPKK